MTETMVQTERLRVVRPDMGRAAEGLAYMLENRGHLAPWSHFYPDSFELDGWKRRLDRQAEEEASGRGLHRWVETLEHPGLVAGMLSFTNVVQGTQSGCDLGYSLGAEHQGHGLMYEALSVVIPLAVRTLALHRVKACYVPENARSAALLRRLGFEIEGYARDMLWINGGWRDHVITSLILPGAQPPSAP